MAWRTAKLCWFQCRFTSTETIRLIEDLLLLIIRFFQALGKKTTQLNQQQIGASAFRLIFYFLFYRLTVKCRFVAWQRGLPRQFADRVHIQINSVHLYLLCVWVLLTTGSPRRPLPRLSHSSGAVARSPACPTLLIFYSSSLIGFAPARPESFPVQTDLVQTEWRWARN